MRKARFPVLLGALALGACTATPARQALVAHDLATAAIESVNDAYEAHLLTAEDLRSIAPYAEALRAAQQSLIAAAQSSAPTFASDIQAVHEATLALLRARQAALAAHPH